MTSLILRVMRGLLEKVRSILDSPCAL